MTVNKKLAIFDLDHTILKCNSDHSWLDYLINKGFVKRKENYVNWDPKEQTVLANEQVVNGRGWRSGAVVERKKLSQCFFDITKYSEDLLQGLDELKNWPEKVKIMQKNWIGKSTGCEIKFNTDGINQNINVFPTRPDTIFGASFLAVSVDHPICKNFANDESYNKFYFGENFQFNSSMSNSTEIKNKMDSFNKTITVPGDKSLSIRWVLFSSIAKGESKAFNLLLSEDVLAAIKAVKKLGIKVKLSKKNCSICGNGPKGYKYKKNITINAENSGTL